MQSLRFNGAALFQVRKEDQRLLMRKHCETLQWGRTFSSAESDPEELKRIAQITASMGPHFFKCGKPPFGVLHDPGAPPASMGPHFFKCGKIPTDIQARLKDEASMGPHFFKCGKW